MKRSMSYLVKSLRAGSDSVYGRDGSLKPSISYLVKSLRAGSDSVYGRDGSTNPSRPGGKLRSREGLPAANTSYFFSERKSKEP